FYPDLEARQIRVLIFKDCDRKGKKLLYDTKVSSKSDEKSQLFLLETTSNNSSIISLRSPHQLLLTKVFSLKPVLPVSTCYSEDSGSLAFSQVDSLLDSSGYDQDSSSLSSQNNSPKDFKIKEVSIPVAVPGAIPAGSIEPEDDSGFTASLDSMYASLYDVIYKI
ncbi:hypothetical protein AC249_AIPGENE27579, partial [Exaiptasia diaphana]